MAGLGLEDKVVIVTGAARGLGEAYAEAFAEEGAKTVISDILDCGEAAKAVEAKGGEVLALNTDVTSKAQVDEMTKKAFERFGRIDVLVNNAGIYGGLRSKFFTEWTGEDLDKMLTSHIKGTLLCCQAVFPYMKKQGRGKIVNVASGIVWNAFPGIIHYSAAKGGILSLSRTLAREVGPYGINVNTVAPGLILTQASIDLTDEAGRKGFVATTSLGRTQQPESPIGAVLFLASKLAEDISGQCIIIDCGGTMH